MVEIYTSSGTAILKNPLQSQGPPVLFVHGFNSSSTIWLDTEDGIGFASIALNHGLDPWVLDLSDPTLGDIRKLAVEDLHESIRHIHQKKKQKLQLVCHSMGGLLARIVTTENLKPEIPGFLSLPYLKEVAMLATPNHGYVSREAFSDLVRVVEGVLDLFGGDSLKESLAKPFFQMLPGTSFLNRLNRDPPLCPFLSWKNGVALEDLIVPAESAMFGRVETKSIPQFNQQLFHASHGKWLRDAVTRDTYSYAPIYRNLEVASWLFSKKT